MLMPSVQTICTRYIIVACTDKIKGYEQPLNTIYFLLRNAIIAFAVIMMVGRAIVIRSIIMV